MKDIDKATSWYKENKSLFESLANKVADIIKENVEERGLPYHSVNSRVKSLKSFTAKAKKGKYIDPTKQIKDMAGIRVITYLETDASKISKLIEDLFDIDWSNSLDQTQLLGSDRVGYRSVHYVAQFDRNRCKLPEYKRYIYLPFEIQVRSLLQHAWAEIEHDRNYKFGGKLPDELERRFYLVAGSLEMLDREFVAIATEIDKYKAEVKQDLKKGDLDIEVTTASLTEYLSNRFSKFMDYMSEGGKTIDKTIVDELKLFGISTLDQLDKIIPNDLEDFYLAYRDRSAWTTFTGIIRDILLVSDINKYFTVSWRNSWRSTEESTVKLLAKHGIARSDLEKYGIQITPDF